MITVILILALVYLTGVTYILGASIRDKRVFLSWILVLALKLIRVQ